MPDEPIETASALEAEARLRQANRALRLLTECNSAVVQATDEAALLHEICRIAVESAGYIVAWVGRAEPPPERLVSLYSFAGPGEFLQGLRVTWGDEPEGQGVLGTAIRSRRPAMVRDLTRQQRFAPWHDQVVANRLGSAIGIPLIVGDEVFGALAIYAGDVTAFDATEIELLEDLGRNISHGMMALRAQRARAEADRTAAQLLDRLRRAQAVAQVGSWELDLAARTIWASDEAFRIYGLPVPADHTLPYDAVRGLPLPEYREPLDRQLQQITSGAGGYAIEYVIQRGDGQRRTVQSRAELSRDEAGRPVRVLGTLQDVTEQKRLEEQLLQAQKMESVGRLAGGVAHDFNNLLTVIQGCAGALQQELREHPLEEEVQEIRRAAQRAAELTGQLLAFSRKQVLQPRVLDLNEVVVEAERMLRRVIGEDIELATVPARGLRPVFADRGQIEQVIMNLAVNARDAMSRGGKLTIETANAELTSEHAAGHPEVIPGRYVMLAMTDTGEGMDAATRARIFEPFFTTKREKGTGLGLSTVYGIVRQSGGYIWVYSEPGRGTTFKVYLPAYEQGETVPVGPRPQAGGGGPEVTKAVETILVVEDEDAVRRVICAVLRRAGYEVLAPASPHEALDLARGHEGEIHLLITDVVMPRVTGPEIAAQLAAARPGIRVLYMSGYMSNAIVHQGVLEGDMEFIAKPFAPDALLQRVREVLAPSS